MVQVVKDGFLDSLSNMLLHALILATLQLNLAELLVALCLASGNHTVIYMITGDDSFT